jgi:hypothetical protein
MKKNFLKSIFALMCACVMTTSFVACGSDDDDNNKSNDEEHSEKAVDPVNLQSGAAEFAVTFTGLEALRAMSADGKVMVRYTYGKGDTKSEEVTGSTFQTVVDYLLNDKGQIIASIQVYLNDINVEKATEIIGTEYMEAILLGALTLKYENTKVNRAIEYQGYYQKFERTESMVNAAIRDLQREKERYGVIPLLTYGLKVSETSSSSGDSWLGK